MHVGSSGIVTLVHHSVALRVTDSGIIPKNEKAEADFRGENKTFFNINVLLRFHAFQTTPLTSEQLWKTRETRLC